MKKLYRNIKRSSLLAFACSALLSSQVYAGSAVAVVSAISGRAFVSIDGRTKSLHQGDQIEAFSEVFTEVGAQVTMSDYYDHKYNLAGSGHIQFLNKSVQLKEGYLWVQSYQDRHTFGVQTANALATFKRGEGIVSFDSFTGRSQLLVKKGEWQYANAFNQMLSQTLAEGQFSFVMMDQEEGAPRAPTPIGYHSFNQIVALFKNVDQSAPVGVTAPAREIASVPVTPEAQPQIEFESNSQPAPRATVDPAMESKLMQLYAPKLVEKKPAPKKWKPAYEHKTNVEVRIFGQGKKRTPASVVHNKPKAKPSAPSKRSPASVGGMAPVIKADAFESKLMQEYKNQMRHSSETNKLINELKSFDKDYVEGY